jgi:hypothetical protein
MAVVVLCAYTGGYTELGGGEEFLKKIRGDIDYKRIVPAVTKRGPKFKREQRAEIKSHDSGITGSNLLERIIERFKKNEYNQIAVALIVLDDTDCRMQDAQRKYCTSKSRFIEKIKEINPHISIIFFFADPEIEIWFYYDAKNIFRNNIKIIRQLNKAFGEYRNGGWYYDASKDSCVKKYSEIFTHILNQQKTVYSKRQDGSDYLRKISPFAVAEKDREIYKAIRALEFVTGGRM